MRRDVWQSVLHHYKYFLVLLGFMMNFNRVENVLNWSNLKFKSNPLTMCGSAGFKFMLFSSLR